MTNDENPFYPLPLVKYLTNYCLPYFPLWSATAISKFGLLRDSNAAAENLFKLVKHSLFRNLRKQKISRYILRNARYIDSRDKERTYGLKRWKGGVKPPEESWRKTRQRKKNKHFKHPKFVSQLEQDEFMKEVMALNEEGIIEYKSMKDIRDALDKDQKRKDKDKLKLEKKKARERLNFLKKQKKETSKQEKKNKRRETISLKRSRKRRCYEIRKKSKVEEINIHNETSPESRSTIDNLSNSSTSNEKDVTEFEQDNTTKETNTLNVKDSVNFETAQDSTDNFVNDKSKKTKQSLGPENDTQRKGLEHLEKKKEQERIK